LVGFGIDVIAVVTNPDRPAGRKLEPKPPPVKVAALDAGLDVIQPEKARDPEFIQHIRDLAPDVAPVVAYGKILPASLLEIPPLGFVNVHFSLLPAYRGAAPVQRALMDGVDETGVSIILLTEGMDEGPILAVEKTKVAPDESAGEVGERLAEVGAGLLVDSLKQYAAGALRPVEQDHAAATYASKIDSEQARIDWSQPAENVRDLARALDPEPGAWTTLRGRRIKIFRARPSTDPTRAAGEIAWSDGRLSAGTGTRPVDLTQVQPAGKRRMSGDEMARGLRPAPGERFE
jgi:methionyl-tRNA formyltransferase